MTYTQPVGILPSILPSGEKLVELVIQKKSDIDVNSLHRETYDLLLSLKSKYYEEKVNAFLSKLKLRKEDKKKIKIEMLKPVVANRVKYSNIMEEASRRISQSFQPLSGQIAELCAERELIKVGLKRDIHYTKRKKRTDLIVYHPNTQNTKAEHRIEVKNVKLRERAVRGLAFDGESLFGFFDSPTEFTQSTVTIIEKTCETTKGYCYVPPLTLNKLSFKSVRLRPNTVFGRDMATFVREGRITRSK